MQLKSQKVSAMSHSGQTLRGTVGVAAAATALLSGGVLTTREPPPACARLAPHALRPPPISAASSSSSFSIFFLVLADGLVIRWLAKNSDTTDISVPQNTMPMIWIIVNPAERGERSF